MSLIEGRDCCLSTLSRLSSTIIKPANIPKTSETSCSSIIEDETFYRTNRPSIFGFCATSLCLLTRNKATNCIIEARDRINETGTFINISCLALGARLPATIFYAASLKRSTSRVFSSRMVPVNFATLVLKSYYMASLPFPSAGPADRFPN
jgi:hypothetical protein